MHPQPFKIATRTTSCVDRYKTKTKQVIHQNFCSRIPRMIRPASKSITNFRTRDPRDWQLYTVKMIFSQLAKTRLLGKLAAKPGERN